MRLFIGIALPLRLRSHIENIQRRLYEQPGIVGKWVEPKNLHLTVTFIGEVEDKIVPQLTKPLVAAAQSVPAFEVTLTGLELIPRRTPRVLAIGVKTSRDFRELQDRCSTVLRSFRISDSAKPPHLTLARLKSPQKIEVGSMKPISFSVTSVSLFQSQLHQHGPSYKVLSEIPLGKMARVAQFRPNVAICVVNPSGEILLTQNISRPGHWQFPQGGIRAGEERVEAVRRELKEEVGLTDIKILALKKDIYHYRLPKRALQEKRDDAVEHDYIGQMQSLAIVLVSNLRPKLKPDPLESAQTTWVPANRLIKALHPVRRSLGKLAMVELHKLGLTG